jgi:hypothetical protein
MTSFRSLHVLTRLLLILWPLRQVVEGFPTTATSLIVLMSAPLPTVSSRLSLKAVPHHRRTHHDCLNEQRFLRAENLAVVNQTQNRSNPRVNETAVVPPKNNGHQDHFGRHHNRRLALGMALLLLLTLSGSVAYVRHKHIGTTSLPVSATFAHARRHVRRSVYQQQPQQCHTHRYTLRMPHTALYLVVAVPHNAEVGSLPKNGTAEYTRNRFMVALALCTARLGLDFDGSRERRDAPRRAAATVATTRYHCRGFGTDQWPRLLDHIPVSSIERATDHALDQWTLY